MSKIHDLARLGQSVWYDNIRRSFMTSGELRAWIDKGLCGLTSNPSIFSKAIAGSADYDEALRCQAEGRSPDEIYEALALEDIGMAADLFRPVYESTGGVDGYVSLEVDPRLARDASHTVSEAKRLFEKLQRPNIMIKVPATPAGIPAVAELIGSGVNVNVTLLFSIKVYRSVAEAYIRGLEKLAADGPSVTGGHPVDKVASVASFFVSRVDTAVDKALETVGDKDLQGKIAVANANVAYLEFQSIFSDTPWEKLSAKGARVQRLLWASTGTKNPLYSDTLYVDALIGPDTVNTIPPATLRSFLDHGTVSQTLTEGLEMATTQLRRLSDLGVDLDEITRGLQDDGVESFVEPFEALLANIPEKRRRLLEGKKGLEATLGGYDGPVGDALAHLRKEQTMTRIWAHDHRVWKEEPGEIVNRLGWLDSPDIMADAVPGIASFAEEVRAAGMTSALLLGMGGSSLAPEMFRRTFGVREGFLDLSVLDSTDPGAVLRCARELDPLKTLYIVSTKSGGTVETLSFMKYFYNAVAQVVGPDRSGSHFIAITDPGSSLEAMAETLNFRRTFLNDPNIGGRYSALSYFGLVPAGLIGMDLKQLLDRGSRMARNNEGCNCPVGGDNSGARMGAIMGSLALKGRDKLTLIISPPLAPFGAWVEQLIAESTGKEGKGILPVEAETVAEPATYSGDRLFVHVRLRDDTTFDARVRTLEEAGHPVVRIHLDDLYDIGGEIFRWEMATAVAGHFLGINPFDQPNVESAKVMARDLVATYRKDGLLPEMKPTFETDGLLVTTDISIRELKGALKEFLERADSGGDKAGGRSYVALQAYLEPHEETYAMLQNLRERIRKKYRVATTLGYGPRFLHSTGQLHKGDAGRGLFLQFTSETGEDAPIPDQAGKEGSTLSFGILKRAQALGDRRALIEAGRQVMGFHLTGDVIAGIKTVMEAIES